MCGKGVITRDYFCIIDESTYFQPCEGDPPSGSEIELPCETFDGCVATWDCPLTLEGWPALGIPGGCEWQRQLVLTTIAIIILSIIAYIINKCRRPRTGKEQMTFTIDYMHEDDLTKKVMQKDWSGDSLDKELDNEVSDRMKSKRSNATVSTA